MKNHRSHVGRTRLILILLCIVLAAAMLWCALSLILRVGTYSGRTVGKDPVQEQTPAEEVPVEPADLEPTVAENSYDPAGFYEEGGFKRYKSADTIASVGVDVSSHQQDIDWELVAANGVEFAMIRVGYRGYTEGEILRRTSKVRLLRGLTWASISSRRRSMKKRQSTKQISCWKASRTIPSPTLSSLTGRTFRRTPGPTAWTLSSSRKTRLPSALPAAAHADF